MRILVTGGAGFIGSNFVRQMLWDHDIVILDALTYAGHYSTIEPLIKRENVAFIEGNICDPFIVQYAIAIRNCDIVVHFAAESHVDRSIENPGPFLQTNVIGTETVLRAALKAGVKKFIHVSTDEVFGQLGFNDPPFTEDSPYKPRSPYAASKAASDHLVRAYGETYGLPYIITNSSNNYGPYQTPDKIIPLFITNAIGNKPLPVYGDGLYIRDYIHVQDHCEALKLVIDKGDIGSSYCVGGGAEKNTLQVAQQILSMFNRPDDMIVFVPDRPGHDRRYAVDPIKLTDLGWNTFVDFKEGLETTARWYVNNEKWWRPLIHHGIEKC